MELRGRLVSYNTEPEWEYLKSLLDNITIIWISGIISKKGRTEEVKKRIIFEEVMGQKPELINNYKHLLDSETLKKVIDKHPLTKIYLK
jgi:predicted nucleic acid-binding protein